MTPEAKSNFLLKLTRAKGKMYEFGVKEEHHLAVPKDTEPASLFLLTIGVLGDYAAEIAESPDADIHPTEELQFSAKFFDAYLESKFDEAVHQDVLLLAASAYYLAERPGSSYVLSKKLVSIQDGDVIENLLRWMLRANWNAPLEGTGLFTAGAHILANILARHFIDGEFSSDEIHAHFATFRNQIYRSGTARNVLFGDLVTAIAALRAESSSWKLLPQYSQLNKDLWKSTIQRPAFPRELWPSQIMLGMSGIFQGVSGLIQMPTSAGKTRSLEMVLRSAFLGNRARLAVVVVPFRALCHEVSGSLNAAFAEDDVKVNELTDALQMDFMAEIAAIMGGDAPDSRFVLVLTPEKLLYVLRQEAALAALIGLVAYDEGHQFDSGPRGIVYELLLTEIKSLLTADTQTLLISAVIKNSAPVADWLIGANAVIVDGTNLFPTARSVGFATWMEAVGQIKFFDDRPVRQGDFDYFVPRVIEQQALEIRKREKQRFFPERGKDSAKDIALFLGISLVEQGAVAVFCGRKDTADNMAARIVEIYSRGYQKAPPRTSSDIDEVDAMASLIGKHFGEESYYFKAAKLGVFVHHGITSHGLRLAIEFGMQQSLLKYVVCTSTLAQGVNLPIRYLIVSGIYQNGERIKTRDFLNLIGRAGRAGMHTEGLVLFADTNVMDNRIEGRWQFDVSADLMAPEKSEDVSSSLLDIISPLIDSTGKLELPVDFADFLSPLVSNERRMSDWAAQKSIEHPKFDVNQLMKQLRWRRKLQTAVESYLMSNRGFDSQAEFQTRASNLAKSTLAYSVASEVQKNNLTTYFETVARYVDEHSQSVERQHVYAKTLLGVADAREVEEWVQINREVLIALDNNVDWLNATWPLFCRLLSDQFFHSVTPNDLSRQLAVKWIEGASYNEILRHAKARDGNKPWGQGSRKLTNLDTLEFVEKTLSFDCSLILSAVSQFMFGQNMLDEEAASLLLFQKSLKYGLSESLSISLFEHGYADRIIAQDISTQLRQSGYEGKFVGEALKTHRGLLDIIIATYPSYFKMVHNGSN